MSFTIGNNIKITLTGTSHGEYVGVIIEGLPKDFPINFSKIDIETERRRAKNPFSTQRHEPDKYEILSGIKNSKTTGEPVEIRIPNTDIKSDSYSLLPRPGHADYPAYIKYNGKNDYRGGGFFSGRMTAPLVVAGAIAKQILAEQNIKIYSHVLSVKNLKETSFIDQNIKAKTLEKMEKASFPCIEKEAEFLKIIKNAENDSIGGVCEIMVLGMPAGVGEPFFDSIESTLSKLYFSVPGIKGVEFGEGFHITEMFGSEANDEIYIDENKIKLKTNHSGGINGGLSNGMPIISRVAVRPTPSIAKPQKTVNLETMENTEISTKGRHDRAIILRIAPVLEAVTALGIADLIQ